MCRLLRRGARYGHKGEYVASGVMARSWPLRLRSLHADPCAGERVMGIKENSRPKPYTPDSRTPKHLYPNENGFVPDVFGHLRYNIGNLLL